MPYTLYPALLQVAAERDAIWIASDIASIVVALAALVVAVIAGGLLLRINRILGELRMMVRQNLGPVSDRARQISDNVEFVSQVVRSDVAALDASVKALSDRLTRASELMEERVDEFNALMEVVQGEAEDIFIDTASTMRGVREGARSLTSGSRRGEEASSREPYGDGAAPAPTGETGTGEGAALDAGTAAARADEGDGHPSGDG